MSFDKLFDRSDPNLLDEELCKKQKFLSSEDFAMLFNFNLQVGDDGYTACKEDIARMAELGVIENRGFGRYRVTTFGGWLIDTEFEQNTSLPLKTAADVKNMRKLESNE